MEPTPPLPPPSSPQAVPLRHVAPIQIKPPKREEEDTEGWLMTYADTITLLMAFFVILFTLSEPTPEKFANLAEQLRLEGFTKVSRESEARELKKQLQLMLEDSGFDQYASVTETDKTIDMELASTSFFEPGSARFNEKALPILEKVAQGLKRFERSALAVEVEGYTDDTPIATARFPSNWELAGGRAANVVRFFIARGVDPEMLKAVSFAETHPKVQNRDSAGNPIPANQELNRRVVIRVVKKP